MVKEAKAEPTFSAGSYTNFYSEFRTEDSVFSIEKLYDDFRRLQSIESAYAANRKPNDKEREKQHKRWLILKGVFEKLNEVYNDRFKNTDATLSEDDLDDLPPHYSKALGIFNQLERFLEIDIQILREMKPESDTEDLTPDTVQANHDAMMKDLGNLEEQLKFFKSYSNKEYMKKITYIFNCADSLFKPPSPKNLDEDHKLRHTDQPYSQHRKTKVEPEDKKRLATAEENIRRVKTKSLNAIRKYKESISQYNYYGHRRAQELELKISSAYTEGELLITLSRFLKDGKTNIDRECLSFFRSPSRCSGIGRTSLRGMLMDKLVPVAIDAKGEDWLRATKIRQFINDSLDSIQNYVSKVLFNHISKRSSIHSMTTQNDAKSSQHSMSRSM